MKKFFLIGFFIVLSFDTLAQVSFKLAGADTHPQLDLSWIMRLALNPWTYGAIIGYLGAFAVWMTLLKHAPVGPAFAVTHLYVVTVAVISFLFFGERFSPMQIVGSLLIVAGILALACGRSSDATVSEP
jgi:drug/metabolite transporter (DMT)-like permease